MQCVDVRCKYSSSTLEGYVVNHSFYYVITRLQDNTTDLRVQVKSLQVFVASNPIIVQTIYS